MSKGSADLFDGDVASANLYSASSGVASKTIDSGTKTLSSGSGEIDTGISKSRAETFQVNVTSVSDGAEIGVTVRGGSSTWLAQFEETTTSVGNPEVDYSIERFETRA